jgi:predicted PurR-regulated permease PerM
MDPGPSGFDQESLIYRQDLSNQISQLNQKLSYENSNYNANNLNLKNKLNNVNNELKNIEKQDSVFTENVETVNGSIRINWISLWELSEIFLPVSPVVLIIIALLILGFFLKRKNYLPKIEFI